MNKGKQLSSLVLAAALMSGLMCLPVGAVAGPSIGISAASNPADETASQGALAETGGMVTLTRPSGSVITLTSAYLGGSVTFQNPYSGETVVLKTIVARPGCIGDVTTAAGEVYTDEDRLLFDSMTTDVGHMPCNYFSVDTEGVIDIQGMNDNDLLGNTYARFGPREEPDVEGVCLFMTNFYADDGRYWVTTQPALDLFTQLTGIPVVGGPAQGEQEGAQEPPEQTQQVFSDVPPDAWYAEYVQTVYEKGLFSGTGDGVFSPDANMTYAQFLVVLSQFSGETIPASDGAWYQGYVDWAGEKGLIPQEIQDGFDPDAPITRQDMAALFGTFLNAYGHGDETVNSGAASFSDAGDIADYAQEGVALCWRLGIMGGNADGTFAPQATATRAQVAVTMVQMADIMER